MKTEVSKELTAHIRANFAQLTSLVAILESNYRDPNPYDILISAEDAFKHIDFVRGHLQALCVEARDELARAKQNGNK